MSIASDQENGEKPNGEFVIDDTVLLHQGLDLTAGKPWSKAGFIVCALFEENTYQNFEIETADLLRSLWRKSGLLVSADFQIDQYHKIASDQRAHLAAVEKTKLLPVANFPVPTSTVVNRIAEICETSLVAKNPFDGQSVFHFRVIRPNSRDHNPLHRDVWLEDYANCINLYIPIAGSSETSSLKVIPGSHHWPENKVMRTTAGAIVDGIKYHVPAVKKINAQYEIVRPNPKRNEVLVFSPYLLHGGADNLNLDQTRISIELRLWKKY